MAVFLFILCEPMTNCYKRTDPFSGSYLFDRSCSILPSSSSTTTLSKRKNRTAFIKIEERTTYVTYIHRALLALRYCIVAAGLPTIVQIIMSVVRSLLKKITTSIVVPHPHIPLAASKSLVAAARTRMRTIARRGQ